MTQEHRPMASTNPPSTRRLKKNDEDLRLMKAREEIAKLTVELNTLPEGDAKRLPIQQRLNALRKELMASLGATKKM
jgi:hypothetical protein